MDVKDALIYSWQEIHYTKKRIAHCKYDDELPYKNRKQAPARNKKLAKYSD